MVNVLQHFLFLTYNILEKALLLCLNVHAYVYCLNVRVYIAHANVRIHCTRGGVLNAWSASALFELCHIYVDDAARLILSSEQLFH